MFKIKSSSIARLLFVCYLLFIMGCASSLTIKVMDAENKTPISDVDVSVKARDIKIALTSKSNASGALDYPEIKMLPVVITLEKEGQYFSIVDTTISTGSLKEPIVIYLNELQTIVFGEVLDTSFIPLSDVLVSTSPSTIETTTNSNGRYILKSNLFLNAKYNVIAEREGYEMNQINNIPVLVNQKNSLEPIELKKKMVNKGPGLEDDIETIPPDGGEGKIWIE